MFRDGGLLPPFEFFNPATTATSQHLVGLAERRIGTFLAMEVLSFRFLCRGTLQTHQELKLQWNGRAAKTSVFEEVDRENGVEESTMRELKGEEQEV